MIWIVLLFLGLLVGAGLIVLGFLQTAPVEVAMAPPANIPASTPSSGGSWEITMDPWVLALTLIIVVGLVILNRRSIFGAPVAGGAISVSLPKTGSLPAQLLTSMLVFALLLYALWGVSPDAKLFTTGEGWATIAIYCVAMTTAALVAVNFKGFWTKFTPAVMLFIFFSLTGFHTWTLLNSDGVFEKRTHIAAWFSSWHRGDTGNDSTIVAFRCDGTEHGPFVATYQPQPIDVGTAKSTTYFRVAFGSIKVAGPAGYMVINHDGVVEQRINPSMEWRAQKVTAVTPAQYTTQCIRQ